MLVGALLVVASRSDGRQCISTITDPWCDAMPSVDVTAKGKVEDHACH